MRPLLVVPALFGTCLSLPGARSLWGRFANFYGGAPLARLGEAIPGAPAEVIKAFSIVPGVRYDVLGALEQALERGGYRAGETLFFFSYDWRLPVTEIAPRLRSAIAELAERRGEEVDLLGLSNGGLVVRAAFSGTASAPPVHTVVTSGTPHAGTVEALACLHSGFQFAPLGRRVGPAEFMACPGSLDCLPPPQVPVFLPAAGHENAQLYDAQTWIDLGMAVFRERRSEDIARWRPTLEAGLTRLRATWSELVGAHPPKRLACVVGKGLPTQARVPIVGNAIVVPGEGHVASLPAAALEEGDGGVTLASATAWQGEQTRVFQIPVSRHRDVVRTPAAFTAILASLAEA